MTGCALELSEVEVHFGGVRAVDGVSLDVEGTQIVGLLGQNGAGKTTLLNCISRSVKQSGGQILVFGQDIGRMSPHQVTRLGVARTFQSVALFGALNALQVGLLGRDFLSRGVSGEYALRLPRARRAEREAREQVREALRFVGFDAAVDRPLGTLSYGQTKLADLARAVVSRPRVLLLDEPAAGLTHGERNLMAEAVERVQAELSAPVVVIEHDIDLMRRLCHRAVIMDSGRVIGDGALDELLALPRVRESLLGEPAADVT